MDFYEELGVARAASAAEIRKSYKCLTLLLHPDQQQNPEVRALAESQMKRINEIIAILTDPERRRIYDDSLSGRALVVRQIQPVSWIPWVRNNQGWMLVGVAFVLLLISPLLVPIFDSARSSDKMHGPAGLSPASARVPEKKEPASSSKARTESRLGGPNFQPSPAGIGKPSPAEDGNIPSPAPRSAADPSISVPQSAPIQPAPIQVVAPLPLPSAPAAPRASATLAGRWVYTPDPSDLEDPKLYPAEYVELSIVPQGSAVRGVYQARYKLPDHTLNSRVAFTFEGPMEGTSFAWQGDSGAQGEITMRLQSADTLKVNWFATKMGPALSLGSGNATLYRFR
jgi:DnaJ domain